MSPKPTFNLDLFRASLERGLNPKEAAAVCGVSPESITTLLRRRGWRMVRQTTLVPIEPRAARNSEPDHA